MKRIYTLCAALSVATVMMAQDAAKLVPATFDDLDLPGESWWVGDVDDPDYMMGTFRSGSFEFNNYYMAEWGSWGFFGYANETGNVFPGGYDVKDQMLNCVGGGFESVAYGMGFIASYMGKTTITMPDFADTGVNVKGVWLTNSAWVVKAILEGDGISGPFGQGDYLKLIFNGFDKDGKESSIEYYLADYRSENEVEHYYVDSWRYCDLSGLGDVVRIEMDMVSTKANDYGMTTPAYFAFDNLGASSEDTGVDAVAELPAVRVSVADGVATVSCATEGFRVEAVGIDGAVTAAETSGDMLHLALPAKGVNILRITTGGGVRTLKLICR